MAGKSPKSTRKIDDLSTLDRLEPASSSTAATILHRLLGLSLDAAFDDLVRLGSSPDLTRDEDEVAVNDALGVRGALEGSRRLVGVDDPLAHAVSTRSMLAPSARRRSSIRS